MAVTITTTDINASVTGLGYSTPTFRMSNGKIVLLWKRNYNGGSNDQAIQRGTSSNGTTWSYGDVLNQSATTIWSFAVCKDPASDVLYGAYWHSVNQMVAFKMVYTSGSDTWVTSTATFGPGSPTSLGSDGHASTFGAAAHWDATNSQFHAAASGQANPNNYQVYAFNTSLGLVSSYTSGSIAPSNATDFDLNGSSIGFVYAANSQQFYYVPISWNGSTYTVSAAELVYSAGVSHTAVAARILFDNSGNAEYFFVDAGPSGGTFTTLKRTAANTFTAATSLTNPVYNAQNGYSVAKFNNSNSDIIGLLMYTGTQGAGEIYYLKRIAGSWGSATLLAGGDANGWWGPTGPYKVDPGSHMVDLYYVRPTQTNPVGLVYDSVSVNTVPATPTMNSGTTTYHASTAGGTASLTVSTTTTDPDGDTWFATFYNASGNVNLGTGSTVSSGGNSTKSSGITYGAGSQNIYAQATDVVSGGVPLTTVSSANQSFTIFDLAGTPTWNAPTANKRLPAGVATVSLSATSTDSNENYFQLYEYSFNGGGFNNIGSGTSVAGSTASTFSWATSTLLPGTYTLRATPKCTSHSVAGTAQTTTLFIDPVGAAFLAGD